MNKFDENFFGKFPLPGAGDNLKNIISDVIIDIGSFSHHSVHAIQIIKA